MRLEVDARHAHRAPAVLSALELLLMRELFQPLRHVLFQLAGGEDDRNDGEIVVFISILLLLIEKS